LDSPVQNDESLHKAITAPGLRLSEKIHFFALNLAFSDAQPIEDFLRLDSFRSRPDLVRQDGEVWTGARHSPMPSHLHFDFKCAGAKRRQAEAAPARHCESPLVARRAAPEMNPPKES
jgi:hypothetical protein